jgi:DNA-binding CsgD family transcriptional regulator
MGGQGIPQSRIKNLTRFSLSEELRQYLEAWQRYWPLISGIGLFFGWLLSFPLQGPLFWGLTQVKGLDAISMESLFLIGHIAGLIFAGLWGYFFQPALKWFSLGGIFCFIFSILLTWTPIQKDGLLFALIGLFSGMAIISWGTNFAKSVPSSQRGRTFILAAVIANLVLYLMNRVNGWMDIYRQVDILSILTFSIPSFLVLQQLFNVSARTLPMRKQTEPANILNLWPLLLFILIIDAVGGLMYSVIGKVSSTPTGGLNLFGLIPYIILLFFAGTFSDSMGRRINAFIGPIVVGIGFMFLGIFKGDLQYIMVQAFMVGGYAFLDTFTWVTASDLSTGRKAPIYFSVILATNILAILLGVLLGGKIGDLAIGNETLTASIAGICCFLSLALVFRLKETLRLGVNITPPEALVSFEAFSQEVDFTPREMEIVKLLIGGSSTQEILEKLIITPNTLKTHVHNIYHKVGARNRWEFTMIIMKVTSQSSTLKTN